MNSVRRVEVMNLEHPDQLESTAKFLEDLATRVAGVEERQLCLSEAQRYRFAAHTPWAKIQRRRRTKTEHECTWRVVARRISDSRDSETESDY